MKRSRRQKLTAFLIAVLFLGNGAGQAMGAHPCPHHGMMGMSGMAGMAGPSDTADMPEMAMAEMAAGTSHHAGVAQPGGQEDSHSSPTSGDTQHTGCTCLCPCHSASTATAPNSTLARLEPHLVRIDHPVRATDEILRSRHDPFFLPYANAPPSLG